MKRIFNITFLIVSLYVVSASADRPGPRTQALPNPEPNPLVTSDLPDIEPDTNAVSATMRFFGAGVQGMMRDIKSRQPTAIENRCSSILNTCSVNPTGNQDVSQVFETLSLALGTGQINREGYCNCLRENVPHTAEAMNTLKRQLKVNLRKDVKNKIVQDFSQQLEDLHFYWKLPSFRQKVMEVRSNSAADGNFRCLAEADYINAFNANVKCQALDLDESGKKRKLADIFSSFTDVSSGNLQEIISKVKDDVLMTNLSGSNCSSPETYSRVCFERDRISLARSSVGQVPDRFLGKIIKNSGISQEVILRARRDDHSPIEALIEILEEKISTSSSEILPLIDRGIVGDALYQKLSSGSQRNNLSVQDKNAILNSLRQVVVSGMEIHPGINQLLGDVDKFEEVSGTFSGTSLMGHLEGDSSKIIDDYRNKCDSLLSSLAEVACSSDDDLLNGMDGHDLKEYAEHVGIKDEPTLNLTKVMACENPSSHDFLQHLVPGAGFSKVSDYVARQNNLLSSFDKLRQERFKSGSIVGQVVAGAVTRYGSSSSDFFDFDFFDVEISETSFSQMARRDEPLITPVRNEDSQGKVLNEIFSNLPPVTSDQAQGASEQNFYANSMANASVSSDMNTSSENTASSESRFDPRRELREYLRGRAESEEIDNLLSNTDDSLMKELLELKAEMESNQKKLLELSAENERLRLDTMRRRMDDLNRDRSALEPGEVRRSDSAVSRRDSPLAGAAGIGRNIASAPPVETGGVNSGVTSTGGASTGGDVSSESASLSGLNRALLSSAGGASRGPASESSSNPVVVSASSAKSGSLEVKSQEVGLDLLNYLSNNGSDIQTLINLKTAGIIYKYRVLEGGQFVEKEVLIEYGKLNEDVKKIIDKKIAENKDRSKEVLRLDNEIKELQRVYSYSALRLLLANQVRSAQE